MASACINQITISPEKFLSRPTTVLPPWTENHSDLNFSGDFEFSLDVPVNILPADQLFSNGKLITSAPEIKSPEKFKTNSIRKSEDFNLNTDPYLFSPRAPRCSSRWKDLLGLKKLNISIINGNDKPSSVPSRSSDLLGLKKLSINGNATVPSRSSTGSIIGSKSIKMFLHRSSKSTESAPLLVPEEFVASGRLSLSSSSSSSGGDHHDADLPRHSLDSDKFRRSLCKNQNPPRVRLIRKRTVSSENPVPTRMSRSSINKSFDLNNSNNLNKMNNNGAIVDSPRMNASGRVIFQGLERSSSSPSSFNNGPRMKYKGMERSYSANVRVTPVLNVPMKSSVFGFQLFPSNNAQKNSGLGGGRSHVSKVRTEK